jgi:hypothetical protein
MRGTKWRVYTTTPSLQGSQFESDGSAFSRKAETLNLAPKSGV